MDNPLTKRQTEILGLITKGQTTQQIAAELGIALKTVTTHKSRIYMKLKRFGVKSNEDLIEYANVKHLQVSAKD